MKYTFDESDESVVERWVENPYWQYFCGYEQLQHDLPLHPTTLVKWRNRVGDKLEALLEEILNVAMETKALKPHTLKHVNVDTTVQEKAIGFPTDARLYHKMRVTLVREAHKRSILIERSTRLLKQQRLDKNKLYSIHEPDVRCIAKGKIHKRYEFGTKASSQPKV